MMCYREDFTPEELKKFMEELKELDEMYKASALDSLRYSEEFLANNSEDDIEAAMEEAEYNDFLQSLPR